MVNSFEVYLEILAFDWGFWWGYTNHIVLDFQVLNGSDASAICDSFFFSQIATELSWIIQLLGIKIIWAMEDISGGTTTVSNFGAIVG
jgi:hypothetical protein